jgi:galactonate dehydratase
VRAFYTGWYRELVTELPVVSNGMVSVGAAPGLGLELLPDIQNRKDAITRKSGL